VTRAFLYARVSTADKDQDPTPQIDEMKDAAVSRDWVPTVFVDQVSSGKRRPELERMLALAYQNKCNVVVCRHFDRIARSTRELLEILDELSNRKIDIISMNQNIDTTTPHGRLMFTVIAAFAEFERSMIRERVKLGLAAARARGTRLGRPRRIADALKIRRLRASGATWEAIAKATGVSIATAKRIAKNAPMLPERVKIPFSTGRTGEHRKRLNRVKKTR
jgi:DNA invertase Pin-like site-specific DNA recombinase